MSIGQSLRHAVSQMLNWNGLLHLWFLYYLLFFYIIAVSYTHLRAHETVLDLVCRLLLEKKNIDGVIVYISRDS